MRNSFDPAKLGDQPPATDLLLGRLAGTVVEQREHQHPTEGQGPDLHCLNLTSFMGDRMGAVLRRVADEQSEVFKERQRATALAEEFEREADAIMAERDRYHEVADHLARALAAITGADIGEHSSMNDPWQKALDAAESYVPSGSTRPNAIEGGADRG